MTAQQKIDKILEIKGIELTDFAMKCGIIPNSLKVAIKRNALSSDIVTKIHDTYGVRKEFLKTGSMPVFTAASDGKPTREQIDSDNKGKASGVDLSEAIRIIIEGSEYFVIPKVAIEGKYRLMPLEEISLKEKELERRNDELIRKDHQIQGLYEIVKVIASGAPTLNLPKLEDTKKNAGV